jgi:hypothetical protein
MFILPLHCVQMKWFSKTKELNMATVSEGEVFPRNKLANHLSNEDLVRRSLFADAGRGVDDGAEQVTFIEKRFAGIQADANGDRGVRVFAVMLGQRSLNSLSTRDGVRSNKEGYQKTVARALDLGTVVSRQASPDDGIVGV